MTGQASPTPVHAAVEPANDNVPGTVATNDRQFFLALGTVCAGVLLLVAYMAMSGPDDLMTVALRR